jgi:hypothetical protein
MLNGVNGQSRLDRVVPLDVRLQAIAEKIPASIIDELWVFPPLPSRDVASEFLVLVCFDGGEGSRRILTSQLDLLFPDPESDEFEWVQRVREHGTAPRRWVADIPDRLLQRLSEAGVPEVIPVGGRLEAWSEAVSRFTKGEGDGDGNGNGGAWLLNTAQVDIRQKPVITFTTVIESTHFANGAQPESG